jgi:hypothetical protein
MSLCPHCSKEIALVKPDVQTFETPGWSLFPARRRFNQTAAQPWAGGREPQPPPAPVSNINTTELQPGEKRESTRYRPKTIHDLLPALLTSGVLGVCSGVLARSVDVGVSVFGGTFLVLSVPVVWVDGANVKAMVERLTRIDIDGDGKIGNEDININTTIQENGGTKHNTIRIPLGMARAWRNFCQAVTQGDCNFSGTAAEDKGVDPVVFKRIVEAWTNNDPELTLIDPKTVGPRKTMRLVPRGESVVADHCGLPLPQLAEVLEGVA